MRPNVLLISEETLKSRTIISDNIDPKILRQTIIMVQEEKILNCLGSKLYDHLITAINDSTLTDDEKILIEDYVTPVMSWYCLAELPMAIGVKFYNRNVLRKTGDNDVNLSMSELTDVMNYYKNKGEFQEQRLINYLRQNAPQKFPVYLQWGFAFDTIRPKRTGYTCPFVIPDQSRLFDAYGNILDPNGNNYE